MCNVQREAFIFILLPLFCERVFNWQDEFFISTLICRMLFPPRNCLQYRTTFLLRTQYAKKMQTPCSVFTPQNIYWNTGWSDRSTGTPLSHVKLKIIQKMRIIRIRRIDSLRSFFERVRLTVFFLLSERMITTSAMLLMRSVKQTGKMTDTYNAEDWFKKQL